MIVDVVMPKMGESIMEGTILEWKVGVGDSIEKDDVLLEISTDKVDSEIPSPVSGSLVEVLFEPNATIPVGEVIARIGTEGEGAAEGAAAPTPETEAPVTPEPSEPDAVPKLTPKATGTGRFFSPLVRSIAAREGISQAQLEAIPGSGKSGRVTKADILDWLKHRGAAKPLTEADTKVASLAATAPPLAQPMTDEVVPMDRMRQRIAEHMRHSLETSAHVYAVSEADMTEAVAFRARHKESFTKQEGLKLTFTPMIAYAAVKAIRDFPLINSALDGTSILRKRHVNLGIAVALPDNHLIVPVIHRAEELNFLGMVRQIADHAARARAGELKPEEAAGSTFSITNPGIFGNLFGLPIINQPNVAILAVGAIKKRPVIHESEMGDSIVVRSMMMVSLAHDHRLIDGAYGGQFLERIIHYLQTTDWESEL